MATYKEIQGCVKKQSGFVPKTCWIAHVLELNGKPPRVAANRTDPRTRQVPCPAEKRPGIERCLRHYLMI
jgi:hypothetical protein